MSHRPADKQRGLKTKENEKREGTVSCFAFVKEVGVEVWAVPGQRRKGVPETWTQTQDPWDTCQHTSVDPRFPAVPDAAHGEARVGSEI